MFVLTAREVGIVDSENCSERQLSLIDNHEWRKSSYVGDRIRRLLSNTFLLKGSDTNSMQIAVDDITPHLIVEAVTAA